MQTLVVVGFLLNSIGVAGCLRWLFVLEHDRLNSKEKIKTLEDRLSKTEEENGKLKFEVAATNTSNQLLHKDLTFMNQKLDRIENLLTNQK